MIGKDKLKVPLTITLKTVTIDLIISDNVRV